MRNKRVQVNSAYKHGRYEKIWFKSLCVMSKVKVFVTPRQPASQMDEHTYDTHMDQKCMKNNNKNNSKTNKH